MSEKWVDIYAPAYTCAAKPDKIEPEDELENIASLYFLDTLAEAALAEPLPRR